MLIALIISFQTAAAPPITAAAQTALLGNHAPTAALAAYAAVSTAVGFLARVCNFLVRPAPTPNTLTIALHAFIYLWKLNALDPVMASRVGGHGLLAHSLVHELPLPLPRWTESLPRLVAAQAPATGPPSPPTCS